MPHKRKIITRDFSRLKIKLNQEEGRHILEFSGALSVDDLAPAGRYLEDFFGQPALTGEIVFDLAPLDYMDSGGAFLIHKYSQLAEANKFSLSLEGFKAEHLRIYHLLDKAKLGRQPLSPGARVPGVLESLGSGIYRMIAEAAKIIEYTGTIIYQGACLLRRPKLLRWPEVFFQMQQVGVGGLPIVGLIGLLLGMILAFMSIVQLQDFGASIYVAALVSLAMVKELGPIMTAIVVAGRSGSAFAAEIGTMKENEELEALTVMGYDPVMFLAMPRVLATVLVMPLLFIFSCFFGICGGLIVGTAGMGIDSGSYLNYTIMTLGVNDFIVSIVKSMVFAFLIAVVGCQRGFAVRGGASAVGQATTSSVVISIFIIIVVDSIFAIVQQYAWW